MALVHHLGYVVTVQHNPLSNLVGDDMGGAFFFSGAVGGPSADFLFQLEPRVYVVGEERNLRSGKVPDFVNVENGVAATNGLFQFRRAPRTSESTFVVGMLAGGEIIVDTAEWEGEFLLMATRQDRMIEIGRR